MDKLYKVNCDFIRDEQKEYRAGEKVEIIFDFVATDTDYFFHVENVSERNINFDTDRHAYVISFTMPENDVNVYVESRNSMMRPATPLFTMTPQMSIDLNDKH